MGWKTTIVGTLFPDSMEGTFLRADRAVEQVNKTVEDATKKIEAIERRKSRKNRPQKSRAHSASASDSTEATSDSTSQAAVARAAGLAPAITTIPNAYAEAVNAALPRGHGVAAEKTNHLIDKALLRDAKHLGGNNATNGADRSVEGILIQSKYCSSGSSCIGECFDKAGNFKYRDKETGALMQIEVPSDRYDDAVKAMESRILKRQVPGVTDPAEAKNIVRRGHLTYEQARNLGRAGTIESITYDATTGTVTAGCAFGLSAAVRFAQSLWDGDDMERAIAEASKTGLMVGGTSFAVYVLSSQIARTGLEGTLAPATQALVGKLSPSMTTQLATALSGKTLTGAAASSHVAKLLRGNVVTAAVTTAALSSVDLYRLFDGSISGSQAFKNIASTAAGVAGSMGGAWAGAAAGAAAGSMIMPGIGTTVGGVVGGLIGAFGGGAAAQSATKAGLDSFIEDDALQMACIMEDVMKEMAEDYLLCATESSAFIEEMAAGDLEELLRDVYKAEDREEFCRQRCLEVVDQIVANRPRVLLPSPETLAEAIIGRALLADGEEPSAIVYSPSARCAAEEIIESAASVKEQDEPDFYDRLMLGIQARAGAHNRQG